MTIVSTLVTDAMYAARVLGQDQTASSADTQLVLRRFNRMLYSWSNERQMIFSNQTESFIMTPGTASYSTVLLASGRPLAINSMRVSLSGIDYPVEMRNQLWWNAITFKAVNSIPENCFYDPSMDNGTMNFYPRPGAAYTCYVDCQRVLSGAVTLTTDLNLPPGYDAALVAGLACDIWPSFKQAPIPKDLIAERTQTRGVLKRTNYTPLEMVLPGQSSAQDFSNAFLARSF